MQIQTNNALKTKDVRRKFMFYYLEKFFNKWMSKYSLEPLNYQQQHFIMKRFWSEGTVACLNVITTNKELAGVADIVDMGENTLAFTPWTPNGMWNLYDFPTKATAVNKRGLPFIPARPLKLDEEIVIGYAQKNHKSVFSSIEAKLYELVDVEMKKRSAKKAQSQGWLFGFSPEDKKLAKTMRDQIDADDPYLFIEMEDPKVAQGFSNGAPYIVDKLEQERQKIENDILTILGVNNVGIGEKKEHLIVDEVNANNEEIESQSDSYTRELKDFFERINKAFGFKVTVKDNYKNIDSSSQEEDNEDE